MFLSYQLATSRTLPSMVSELVLYLGDVCAVHIFMTMEYLGLSLDKLIQDKN